MCAKWLPQSIWATSVPDGRIKRGICEQTHTPKHAHIMSQPFEPSPHQGAHRVQIDGIAWDVFRFERAHAKKIIARLAGQYVVALTGECICSRCHLPVIRWDGADDRLVRFFCHCIGVRAHHPDQTGNPTPKIWHWFILEARSFGRNALN